MRKDEVLNSSILVVAHPDDEILWFSSIASDVDQVIVCYQDVPGNPVWSNGRRKSLLEHPLRNISSLDITESYAFNGANWDSPVITPYGLEISKKGKSADEYISNFALLKQRLSGILSRYANVFTHNPWGEYGHEEHVQVYRAVKELQQELKFNVWFSNYCSNKSFSLMQRYIAGFTSDYLTLRTNSSLAHDARDIYMKHECMTWYHDYVWFSEESFMNDTAISESNGNSGHIFPLNFIKIHNKGADNRARKNRGIFSRIKSKISRLYSSTFDQLS